MPKTPLVPHVSFVLFPEFQMLAYVLATETLRVANKCLGQRRFTWQTRTATNASIHASNGALITPDSLEWTDTPKADLILFCAGYRPLDHLTARVRAYSSRAATKTCVIGGVDTGTVILAELGLLNGHRAVLHYEAEAAFRERWPEIAVTNQIYCLDNQRLTAAGGTATGDAILAWIARDVDAPLAEAASTSIIHGRPRSGDTPQRSFIGNDPLLMRMHHLMMENMSQPISIREICRELGQSAKQLRRRCMVAYDQTPSSYYRKIRLDVAHNMLANSLMRVSEIAIKCGFESVSSFSRACRTQFGCPPSQIRAQNSRTRQ
ncbi:helix-turn-helix domain-containing protein [Roseovarius sp. M141]|uniref:GlxA family transcriptional regulator n=1 Tax=Roseovarius sp. M141 TaxID=2583806 RepID=UPI0020CE0996